MKFRCLLPCSVLAIAAGCMAATSETSEGPPLGVNFTRANGLVSDNVTSVVVSGSTLYAATTGGLSISTDLGSSWTNVTAADGLANNWLTDVAVMGSVIYVATKGGGVSKSETGGASWTTSTAAEGLGDNSVNALAVSGSTIFAATEQGLSFSGDEGSSWTTYTSADGLGDDTVVDVFATETAIYAATPGGLSALSTGGTSWTVWSKDSGLGSEDATSALVSEGTIYLCTGDAGLWTSADNGATWIQHDDPHHGGDLNLNRVALSSSTMLVATQGHGLLIWDAGRHAWDNYGNVLGSSTVNDIVIVDDTAYAATTGGLSVGRWSR